MEIERKFLLENLPLNIDKFKSSKIEQAYISYEPEIRIRKKNNKYYLTKKSKGDLAREEIEKEITEEFYNLLKENYIENNVIQKTRYYIPLSSKVTAEIDVFEGILENLKTVEVEFNNEEEAKEFETPNWFGEEITYNKEYKNAYLSKLNELSKLKSKVCKNF